jgi:hypothetical protein
MNKRFRAWDGKEYWYADKNLLFINHLEASSLELASFEIKDLEMFIGKIDSKGIMIYENDLIINYSQDPTKIFQVIWSDDECGFRKVPYGLPMSETKIDEAFIEVIGTIHSQNN